MKKVKLMMSLVMCLCLCSLMQVNKEIHCDCCDETINCHCHDISLLDEKDPWK